MINEQAIKDHFAKELRIRMAASDIKSSVLSNECLIKSSTLSKCRHGEALPNPWQLALIANYLGCTADELLGTANFERAFMPGLRPVYLDVESCPGENHYAEHLASNIVYRMELLDFDIELLSKRAKIGVEIIEKILGRWPELPRTIHLIRIAESLKCTPSDLLGY